MIVLKLILLASLVWNVWDRVEFACEELGSDRSLEYKRYIVLSEVVAPSPLWLAAIYLVGVL